MWNAPNRPNNQVTQSFNDGILTVYAVEDKAKAGYKPVIELSKKIVLRYEEQRLGIQRYYSGKQNQIQIERVLRTPRVKQVNNQDIGVTEDGKQYRIDFVQVVQNIYPSCMDITLSKIEQEYEVPV